MRRTIVAIVATAGLLALGLSSSAEAAPRASADRPCGAAHLWATNQAAATGWDANGDVFECLVTPTGDPYVDDSRNGDNFALPHVPAANNKFYSYLDPADPTADAIGGHTGVLAVDGARNAFTAYAATQEDDRDASGCFGVCFERFAYDSGDLFFIDNGNGARKVSIGTFENKIGGNVRFSLIYNPGGTSIFSFTVR